MSPINLSMILIASCLACAASVSARELPAGIVDVTSFAGVYPNDASRDSTAGIQAAMNTAFSNNETLYFPADTVFYVSDTLAGVQPAAGCRDALYRSYRLWGGGKNSSRPTLVLKDSAEGFESPSAPKQLLYIGKDSDGDGVIDTGGRACAFGHAVRNINVVLGHNPGAIGIAMDVAQESVLEDVNIDARSAYAGIDGVPGRTMSVGNIQITGGQFGIRLNGVGAALYGLRLLDQTTAALWEGTSRTCTVVGFDIRTAGGVAVETTGGGRERGHIGLYDGRIELAGGMGTAIDNTAKRIVDLRNVYIGPSATLVDNGSGGAVPGVMEGWDRVDTYAYSPTSLGSGYTSWNLIDGIRSRADNLSRTVGVGSPPADLVSRHIWAGPPDLLDPNVVYVTDAPFGADRTGDSDPVKVAASTAALQAAIDSTEPGQPNAGKWLFVPPGTYQVDHPIVLKSHSHVFGISYGQSTLYAANAWTSGMIENDWVLDTVDDASAETSVEYLLTEWVSSWNRKGLRIGALRWRVGERSVVRGLKALKASSQCEDQPRQIYRIEGSGGGRWYSWNERLQASGNGDALKEDCDTAAFMHPDFRKLYIGGTTQPLTFYGLNPEHGGEASASASNPFIEIADSANIRTFGMKVETNGPVLMLRGASNVFIGGSVAFNFDADPLPIPLPAMRAYVLVDNSYPLAMSQIAAWGATPDPLVCEPLVAEWNMPASDGVCRDAELAHYTWGTLDWSVWPTVYGPKYVVTTIPRANGTITPAGVTLEQWEDQTFTIAPEAGHRIASVAVDGVDVGAVTAYTFADVQSDHTIVGSFEPIPAVTIDAFVASVSSLTAGDAVTLNWSVSEATECTASSDWSGPRPTSGSETVTPTADAVYTLSCAGEGAPATAVVTIAVAPRTYTIAASAAGPGSITPSGAVSVVKASSPAFALVPESGHRIASVAVDGVDVGAVTAYTFADVQSDHTIVGSFQPIPAPTVNLSAEPMRITSGESSLLTWSSADATACSTRNGWSGSQPVNGSLLVSPASSTTYVLVCTGPGGETIGKVRVIVK